MKVRAFNIPAGRFTLYPLSDVHWPEHEQDKLELWRDAVLSDPDAVVTLGGDLCDFARGKYRAHISSFTEDDNSRRAIDDFAYAKVDGLVDFLRPVAEQGKILATCVGNHFWRFANGRVSDQEVAIGLGVGDTFVGALGLLRLELGHQTVRIALHHDAGKKGGTSSADLLAFQHWSHGVDSDIYVMGHTHRQYVGVFQTRVKVDDVEEKISDKKLVFLRSGAFLKGYAESVVDPLAPFMPDYAEVQMLTPSVMGIISVGVTVDQKGKLHYELRQRTL